VIVDALVYVVRLEEEEPYHNKFAGSPFVDFGMDFRWNVVVVGLGVDTAHHQSDLHCHSAGNTAAAAVVVDSVAHVRLVDSTAADAVAVADSGVGVVPCSGNSDGTGTVVVDRVAGGGGCTGRDAVGAVVVVHRIKASLNRLRNVRVRPTTAFGSSWFVGFLNRLCFAQVFLVQARSRTAQR
jgi:hypothetical protein